MIRPFLRATMSFRKALSFRRLGLTALLGTQSRGNAKASDHSPHCCSPCALHSYVTLRLPCSKLEACTNHPFLRDSKSMTNCSMFHPSRCSSDLRWKTLLWQLQPEVHIPSQAPICTLLRTVLGSKEACATLRPRT